MAKVSVRNGGYCRRWSKIDFLKDCVDRVNAMLSNL